MSSALNMWALIMSVFINIFIKLCGIISALFIVLLTVIKLISVFTNRKCKSNARLDGKVALITGGNSGIGLETAKDLARRGAHIVIASRDVEKSAKVVKRIVAETGNKNVEQRYLDLACFDSVRKFAKEFKESFDRLDILVNNSGIGGKRHELTNDGIDLVTQINYFGPFLLTNLLLDKINASIPSRVVIVSSRAHLHAKLNLEDLRCETKQQWYTIYSNTKLLNILWAKALAKQVPKGVTINALHPGFVKTEAFNRYSSPMMRIIIPALIGFFFKTAKEGAQTTIHLAVSEEVEDITGRYFVNCQLSEESKDARNEDLILEVWEKSLLIINA